MRPQGQWAVKSAVRIVVQGDVQALVLTAVKLRVEAHVKIHARGVAPINALAARAHVRVRVRIDVLVEVGSHKRKCHYYEK